MASSESAIKFRDVVKRYRRQQVLQGLTFSVEPGESFGLVGVNGAGKTTCIKGLLDFCQIDGGCIEIFGRPHRQTEARSCLTFLPERFLPPYYLSGRDFLKYMGRLHGVAYVEERAHALLATLDLATEALAKPVREYSKGMAQKLGLCGCFLSGKPLLILDEPMSGLDPKARILVKRRLTELKSSGHTLFFSTHMLSDVEDLCDRMGVLHNGRLQFLGTPRDCCEVYGEDSLEHAFLACLADPNAPLTVDTA